jgi:predicted  nucleic acid-binding Zn-ribbon protein
MKHIVPENIREQLAKLEKEKNRINRDFLDALTYTRPFEEVKKIFSDLKAVEAELEKLKESVHQNS